MTTYDKEFATRLEQQDYAAHLRLVGQGGAAGLVAVPEPPSPSEPAPLGGATEDPLAAAEVCRVLGEKSDRGWGEHIFACLFFTFPNF